MLHLSDFLTRATNARVFYFIIARVCFSEFVSVLTMCGAVKMMTTFLDHVINVVLVGAQEQVIRINTRRVITRMADKHVIGYFTFVYVIRKTMCLNSGTTERARSIQHDAVSFFVSRAGPKPARTCFNELGIES